MKLVNPNNKRRFEIIVVGTGLAGASAAASLSELGYRVKVFTFHDSPRRAHSIAAQGGINGAKNYTNDGDSVHRLFYDTVKGGDYRSREANVHRLAEVSVNIIDQAAAQGVPFAREYGGLLDNRSFGGAQVSRTFYARGQTGQQLLLGAYQALAKQVAAGAVELHTRTELLDVVLKDGRACGIVTRDLVSGEINSHSGPRGGTGNWRIRQRLLPLHKCDGLQRDGSLASPPQRRLFCQPLLHPNSSNLHTRKRRISIQTHLDVRVVAQRRTNLGTGCVRRWSSARRNSRGERDYYLERKYPAFGNLVPRDVASRNAKTVVDQGKGVGTLKNGVYLDFAAAIERDGEDVVRAKYGNLFDMYANITGENPYQVPMRIYPAIHYTMGESGLTTT